MTQFLSSTWGLFLCKEDLWKQSSFNDDECTSFGSLVGGLWLSWRKWIRMKLICIVSWKLRIKNNVHSLLSCSFFVWNKMHLQLFLEASEIKCIFSFSLMNKVRFSLINERSRNQNSTKIPCVQWMIYLSILFHPSFIERGMVKWVYKIKPTKIIVWMFQTRKPPKINNNKERKKNTRWWRKSSKLCKENWVERGRYW